MKKQSLAVILLGITSLFFALWVVNTDIVKSFELRFIDYRFKWRPAHNANPDIVIIAIDDNSINLIGRWPWQRKIHADLLRILSNYPPKALGFDILFTEPEEGDKALEYYTRLLGDVVYAGYVNNKGEQVLPLKPLSETGLVGFINAPPCKDGIIRRIPLVVKCDEELLPSLTLQLVCAYLNISFSDITVSPGNYLSIPGLGNIPIDDNGEMWINFAGDQHVFKETAYEQMLNWDDEEKKLKEYADKLLLVGITATGVGDAGHIPVATNVPLITVHANALNTILNKDFLFKMPLFINLITVFLVLALSTLFNFFFRSIKAVLLTILTLVLFWAVNLWLFQKNILLDILAPSIGIIIPFLLITIYRYGWEERERRWIKKVFAHYLSPEVIETILKDPKKLKLGGELKTATVLHLDLRNFSSFCEGIPPGEVVGFLNETFDWITEIILKHGGMLDKYVGDAIISIFGSPLDMNPDEQAQKAAITALEIVDKWNKMPLLLKGNMGIGIGINTGPMLIGNMGSRYIFNYTAIGDEVNIASRIQGLTDEYNVNIIITESVFRLIKDRFNIESLGRVLVKGRKEMVAIYRLE